MPADGAPQAPARARRAAPARTGSGADASIAVTLAAGAALAVTRVRFGERLLGGISGSAGADDRALSKSTAYRHEEYDWERWNSPPSWIRMQALSASAGAQVGGSHGTVGFPRPPKAHGEHLRTTNLAESGFAIERIQAAQSHGGVIERRASR